MRVSQQRSLYIPQGDEIAHRRVDSSSLLFFPQIWRNWLRQGVVGGTGNCFVGIFVFCSLARGHSRELVDPTVARAVLSYRAVCIFCDTTPQWNGNLLSARTII